LIGQLLQIKIGFDRTAREDFTFEFDLRPNRRP
jgi:hypothetical protein